MPLVGPEVREGLLERIPARRLRATLGLSQTKAARTGGGRQFWQVRSEATAYPQEPSGADGIGARTQSTRSPMWWPGPQWHRTRYVRFGEPRATADIRIGALSGHSIGA